MLILASLQLNTSHGHPGSAFSALSAVFASCHMCNCLFQVLVSVATTCRALRRFLGMLSWAGCHGGIQYSSSRFCFDLSFRLVDRHILVMLSLPSARLASHMLGAAFLVGAARLIMPLLVDTLTLQTSGHDHMQTATTTAFAYVRFVLGDVWRTLEVHRVSALRCVANHTSTALAMASCGFRG